MDHIVFAFAAPLVALLMGWFLVRVWQLRESAGAKAMLFLFISLEGWLLTSTGELLASSTEMTLLWAQIRYVFIAAVPVAWILFAFAFTGNSRWIRPAVIVPLSIVPAITAVLAQTIGWNEWLWQDLTFYQAGPFTYVEATYGPWFWVNMLWGYTLIGVGIVLILREYGRAYQQHRQMARWIVAGTILPILTNGAYILRLIPGLNQDFSPISFGVAALIIGYAVYRLHLFDIQPIARNRVVDSMAEGMIALDEQLRIIDINPAARQVLDIGEADVVGQSVRDIVSDNQWQAVAPFIDMDEAEAELVFDINGRVKHYAIRISPLRDADGHARGHLALLHDITKRQEAEAALVEANCYLAERNRDLDAFARTVAHDLKNPIGTVQGFAHLLLTRDGALSEAKRRELTEAIAQSAVKAQEIIDALLLLAGVHNAQVTPAPVAMEGVVAETLRRLAPMVESSQADVVQPDAWPVALGYAPWIEEVWVNYVSNAMKYGGTPPRVELGWTEAADGLLCFYVEDNGPGLTDAEQAQLFTPFTRLDDGRAEGHGLGLSIVRSIMDKLGGNCAVQRTTTGSRFFFTLPAA